MKVLLNNKLLLTVGLLLCIIQFCNSLSLTLIPTSVDENAFYAQDVSGCDRYYYVKFTPSSTDGTVQAPTATPTATSTKDLMTVDTTTKIYKLYFLVSIGNGTIVVSGSTTNGITSSLNIPYSCVAQPSPVTITQFSTKPFYSGGNLIDSNSIDFTVASYPLPIVFSDTICDGPVQCSIVRRIPNSNLYTVTYTYDSVITSAPSTFTLSLIDLAGSTTNILINSELGSSYVLNQPPAINNLNVYPPENSSPSNMKPVLFTRFSVTPPSSGKSFIKHSDPSSSDRLLMSTGIPISGSPSEGVQFLSALFTTNPTSNIIGFNSTSSLEIDSIALSFGTRNNPASPVCTFDVKFPKVSVSNVLVPIFQSGAGVGSSGSINFKQQRYPYPYGVVSGYFGSLTYSYSLVISANQKYQMKVQSTYYMDKSPASCTFIVPTAPPAQDIVAPTITAIEFIGLEAENAILTIHASDAISGVSNIIVYFYEETNTDSLKRSIQVGLSDLVSGNFIDGVYQKIINYLGYTRITIDISDNANNVASYTSAALKNAELESLIPTFPRYVNGYKTISKASDIVSLSFKTNNVDVSTANVPNELYVKLAQMDPTTTLVFKPYFYTIGSINPVFYSTYDTSAQRFVFKFAIPARTFTGIVDYNLYVAPHNFTNSQLYNLKGDVTQLKVSSSNADQIGPIITSVTNSGNISLSPTSESQNVTFSVTISDPGNGLFSGDIRITSEIDSIGYLFRITPDKTVSGDKYNGIYNLTFTVSPNCATQTYQITYANLVDSSAHRTVSFDLNTGSGIDPMMLFLGYTNPSVKLTCSTTLDQTSPVFTNIALSNSTMDVTGSDQDRTLTLTFQATDDESGINDKYVPSAYISSTGFNLLQYPCTETPISSNAINYSCEILVPFGFGATPEGFAVSIYGSVNNHLRIKGMENKELNLVVTTTATKYAPSLVRSTSTFTTGGSISLFGQRFGEEQDLIIQVDSGSGYVNLTNLTFDLYTGVLLVFDLPSFSNELIQLRVIANNQLSNSILIDLIAPDDPITTTSTITSSTLNPTSGQPTDTSGQTTNTPITSADSTTGQTSTSSTTNGVNPGGDDSDSTNIIEPSNSNILKVNCILLLTITILFNLIF